MSKGRKKGDTYGSNKTHWFKSRPSSNGKDVYQGAKGSSTKGHTVVRNGKVVFNRSPSGRETVRDGKNTGK